MTWYEILIAIAAVTVVAIPVTKKIVRFARFLKTGKAECGGNCSCCGGQCHCREKGSENK